MKRITKRHKNYSTARRAAEGLTVTTLLCAAGSLAAQDAPTKKKTKAEEAKPEADLPAVVVEDSLQGSYKPEKVNTPKYTEPLVNVPQTITVIPKAVMEEQGALTLSEVLRNVPGVTMLAGEGGGSGSTAGDNFFLRGFDASSSIFVNGVRSNGLISRDVYNLEQVEVYKGPTGADTGRATAAGYVNMSTKTPSLRPSYGATAGLSNYGMQRYTIDINQPLFAQPAAAPFVAPSGKDAKGVQPVYGKGSKEVQPTAPLAEETSWIKKSAFRLNGLYQDGQVAGRDYVERENWAIAPTLGFGLGTDFRVILSYEHQEQDNMPDYGVPSVALYPHSALYGNGDIKRGNFYGLVNYDYEKVRQNLYTARFEWDITDDITITNQTFVGDTYRNAVLTSPGNVNINGLVSRSRQGNERENKIFSNQTNITAEFETGPLKHSLTGGLEYTKEEQSTWTRIGNGDFNGGTSFADGYNPNPYDKLTNYDPRREGGWTRGETETYAAYLGDTVHIGEQWLVNGTIRYENYDTNYYALSAANATTGARTRTNLGVSDDLISWKAGIVYKPVENGSIYFSYSKTMTPPGTANFSLSAAANNTNNPNVDPQESENYELGTKWDLFENRLTLSAAVFQTTNSNEITTDNTVSPPTYFYDSKRRVQGLELGASGAITDKWNVFAGFAYLDSEFEESANPTQQGATLQWTPKYSGSLWTTYQLPYGFTIGGGARYVDNIARQTTNTPGAVAPEAPSYWVFDAMLEYKYSENFSLRLNVYNIANERYPASTNNNGQRVNLGAPVSAMLTASFKF